jgi:GTPase SAR1 family protein
MPVLHIVAIGPESSGKSTLVRHLAHNPPRGYKLEHMNAVPCAPNQEYWTLIFKKERRRAKPRTTPVE